MCLHDYKIYDLNYYRLHSEKSESYAFTCVCHSVTEVGEGVVHEGSSHNPPPKKSATIHWWAVHIVLECIHVQCDI